MGSLMTNMALVARHFPVRSWRKPRGQEYSGSWSDQDLAIALPSDPDPNPAGQGPSSAAPVQRNGPEALLQPSHGSPSAGDDWEDEQGEDGWEAALDEEHAPHRSTAKRIKPCDGGLVSKGKRLRVGSGGGGGGVRGGGGDEAALPGPIALGCRPAPGGHEETAALGSHCATPEQARPSGC